MNGLLIIIRTKKKTIKFWNSLRLINNNFPFFFFRASSYGWICGVVSSQIPSSIVFSLKLSTLQETINTTGKNTAIYLNSRKVECCWLKTEFHKRACCCNAWQIMTWCVCLAHEKKEKGKEKNTKNIKNKALIQFVFSTIAKKTENEYNLIGNIKSIGLMATMACLSSHTNILQCQQIEGLHCC